MPEPEEAIARAAGAVEDQADAEAEAMRAQAAATLAAASENGVAAAEAGAALAHVNAAETERLAAEKIAATTHSIEEYQAWNATQMENLSGRIAATENLTQQRIAEATGPILDKVNRLTEALTALTQPPSANNGAQNPAEAGQSAGADGQETPNEVPRKKYRLLK